MIATAADRMERLLGKALARACILEEQVELRDAKIAELERRLATSDEPAEPKEPPTA